MSAPLQVLVDGRLCHEQWPLDRGLQFGDGLFETMRVRSGRVRFEAMHRARLARGCQQLLIRADHETLWRQAQQLAAAHGEALLKLQLTRGAATARGYAPAGDEQARAIMSVYAAPTRAELPATIRAVALRSRLGENPDLAGIKHCNRLEQVLARAALRDTGAFEGLMASSSGRLISGTMSNVFLELDGELVTPAIDQCGIAGVLRAVVMREAAAAGMPLRVAQLPWSALQQCTGLALSNVRLGLLPVDDLDGRALTVSPALRDLAAHVEALDE